MGYIDIDKTFFLVCAGSSIYLIIMLTRLSHSDIDGAIILIFSIILILLPILIPKKMLEGENNG